MLNDLIGKKSAAIEIDEILTGSNVTLNIAQEAANHFNFHFTKIGPNLALIFLPHLLMLPKKCLFFFSEYKSLRVLTIMFKLDGPKATG